MEVAVDLVVLAICGGELTTLLVQRANPPFEGRLALPGGRLLDNEDLPAAAERELWEETGVMVGGSHVEQFQVYGAPGRDPRGRVVTVAFLAVLNDLPVPTPGSDAADARWVAASAVQGLAFDHDTIVGDGVERARARLESTPLATAFCPPEFTLSQLRAVYETVWDVGVDPGNFHRSALRAEGFLRPTEKRRVGPTGAPAQLYMRGDADALDPPLRRPKAAVPASTATSHGMDSRS